MSLTPDLLDELELLNLFDLDSTQQGLKIHHDAKPNLIAAGERLFDKGIISQKDGGYLTDRGVETAKHVEVLVNLLQAETID